LIGAILPGNDWQEVAPLLTVLACLSVFRPITWVLSAYMESLQKTNKLMFLEIAKLVLLIGGIAVLSPYGVRVASGAVGIAFGLTAIGGVMMIMREGPSPMRLLLGFVQPLLACGVMAGAIWGLHHGLRVAGVTHPLVYLFSEIVVGAITYVAAALVLCRETSRDMLGLLKQALRRG